jgi:hypothetical protein
MRLWDRNDGSIVLKSYVAQRGRIDKRILVSMDVLHAFPTDGQIGRRQSQNPLWRPGVPVFVYNLSGQNVRYGVRQLGQREGGALLQGTLTIRERQNHDKHNASRDFSAGKLRRGRREWLSASNDLRSRSGRLWCTAGLPNML